MIMNTMKTIRSRVFQLAIGMMTAFTLTLHSFSADGTWTNNAAGNWSAAGNWAGGTIADGEGSLANFSTVDITVARTVTLDTSRTIGQMVFGDVTWITGGYDWTLASSGGSSLTLNNIGGNPPSIAVSNRTATISVVLAGSNGLNLNVPWLNYALVRYPSALTSPGGLTFTTNNTLGGALSVAGGTVRVGGATGKFGNATALTVTGTGNGVFINGDATAANNSGRTDRIGNGTATLTLGGASGAGTFTMAFPAAANTHAQTFAGLTVNAGQNILNTVNTAAGALDLTFTGTAGGGYVRGTNGLVRVVSATGFNPQFSNAPTAAGGSSVSGPAGSGDEILSGAVLNDNDFIKAASGSFSAATYVTTLTAGKNVNVTGDLSAGGNLSINSLRFNDATKRTLTIGSSDTLTIVSGGIIVGTSSPAGAATVVPSITNGTLTSGTSELFFSVQNAKGIRDGFGLLVSSKIVDNGAPVNLDITGSAAVLLSNTNNSFTGNIYLNGGMLALASSSGGVVTDGVLGGSNMICAVSGFNYIRADLGTANPWTSAHNISISAGAFLDICTQNGPITNKASVTGSGVLGIGMGTYNQGNGVIMPADESGFTGTYLVGTFLRANDGVGLSQNANLALAANNIYGNNGVLETSANVTRSLGTGAGQVQFGKSQGNSFGGGFAAVGGPVTISLGGLGTPTALTYGTGGFFTGLGNGGVNGASLVLQRGNANNTLTWANPINNNGYLLAINQNAPTTNSTTAATMTGALSGTGGLLKVGAGLLALTGDNTYSGLTSVAAGTLALGNTNAVKNSTLDMGLAGSQSVTFSVEGINAYNLGGLRGTNNIALGANTLVIGSNNSTNAYWGTLSGLGGGFVKTGAGMLTLSGTNTYTGATVAQAGVLELTLTNALSSATALDIRSGAEVKLLFTGTNVVYSLTVNGFTKSRGVYAAGSLPGLTGSAGAYLQTLQPSPRGTMISVF